MFTSLWVAWESKCAELRPKFMSDSLPRPFHRGVRGGKTENTKRKRTRKYGSNRFARRSGGDDTCIDGIKSMINRFRYRRARARMPGSGNAFFAKTTRGQGTSPLRRGRISRGGIKGRRDAR